MHGVVDQGAGCESSNDERDAGPAIVFWERLHQAGVSSIKVFDVSGKQGQAFGSRQSERTLCFINPRANSGQLQSGLARDFHGYACHQR